MSQERVARYRVPPVRSRSRRTLVERLALRFPRFARLYGSALLRLRPDSRLRRELLPRAIRDNTEAYNRGDREAFLVGIDPEGEINPIGGAAGLDLGGHYHGREGFMRFFATIDEALESNRLEPEEVIDFGNRYLVLHHIRARGRGSGVDVDHAIGLFVTWSKGQVVRVDYYWSQDEALEAAGLSE
jgi:hypothetical protein